MKKDSIMKALKQSLEKKRTVLSYLNGELSVENLKSKNIRFKNMSNWINISEKTPHCYMEGSWDGKMSDLVLVKTLRGERFTAKCFEGFMDGNHFYDWYQVDEINGTEYSIESKDIALWMEIPFL